MRSLLFFLLCGGAGLLGASTFVGGPAPRSAAIQSPPADYDPVHSRPNEEGDTGALSYQRYCGGCHGENGDGKGAAAAFLTPRPRDFTTGLYKFTSTPAGSPPLEEDLLRTITEGLHGTSMPSWRLLPERERRSLARYIKAFHNEWQFRTPSPPVPMHENPFDLEDTSSIDKAVAQGREVYHLKTSCWSCHPAYLPRGELETLTGTRVRDGCELSIAKPDHWGEVILPPDFQRDRLKSVRDLRDLYQVITAGVGGTAMPSWKDALSAVELWALTLYVDSLRPQAFSTTQRKLKALREAASQ